MNAQQPQPFADLACPRLPLALRAFNRLAYNQARRHWRLAPAELLARARQRARLVDFGGRAFEQPLAILTDALEREARLSPLGRLLTRELLLQLLVTRLRLQELVRRFPQIEGEPVCAPLFVVGLPRSGATALQAALATDPRWRTLTGWESLEPISANLRAPAGGYDLRPWRFAQAQRLVSWALPHAVGAGQAPLLTAQAELQLQAADFRSPLFEAAYRIPSYGTWLATHDHTASFRFMRRLLQALQWLGGPRRWLLKLPAQPDQLLPLLEVFPDARILLLHRDPAQTAASWVRQIAYSRRLTTAVVDPTAEGSYWLRRLEGMLHALVRDWQQLPAGQVADIAFTELAQNPLLAVRRAYRQLGEPLLPAVQAALASLQLGQDSSLQAAAPALAALGPHGAALQLALGSYQQAFVPREVPALTARLTGPQPTIAALGAAGCS